MQGTAQEAPGASSERRHHTRGRRNAVPIFFHWSPALIADGLLPAEKDRMESGKEGGAHLSIGHQMGSKV